MRKSGGCWRGARLRLAMRTREGWRRRWCSRIAPQVVRLERAEAGCLEPLPAILPAMRAGGVVAVSPNGVLGDPTGASSAEGEALLVSWVDDLVAAVGRIAAWSA